jgi:hypothetical protein
VIVKRSTEGTVTVTPVFRERTGEEREFLLIPVKN